MIHTVEIFIIWVIVSASLFTFGLFATNNDTISLRIRTAFFKQPVLVLGFYLALGLLLITLVITGIVTSTSVMFSSVYGVMLAHWFNPTMLNEVIDKIKEDYKLDRISPNTGVWITIGFTIIISIFTVLPEVMVAMVSYVVASFFFPPPKVVNYED